jgi:hypothetical protein
MEKQWIFAHESNRELVHEIFGEPTLLGRLFTDPIHKIKGNRIMFYADNKLLINYYNNLLKIK